MLAAFSFMFPYLLGLGFFLFLICRSIQDAIFRDSINHLQLLACILVFGVEINYFTVLFLTNLNQSLIVGLVLSGFGWTYFVVFRMRRLSPALTAGWFALFIILCIACMFFVLVDPVDGWDARSIWFFHPKMIYYNGSVDAGGDWSLPSVVFSHPDYPKIIAVLAAQIAFVAGYWNEYLPKMALAALLVPAILCLISILIDKWWHMAFISVPLLFTWVWLKNGYMDGYLALYAGLATFYWGRWLDKKNWLDFISGVLFTGVILGLKNEGMLYCLIVAVLLLFFVLIRRNQFRITGYWKLSEGILLVILSASGFFLWESKKQIYYLQNDLQLGLNSLDKILLRLTDGSLVIILKHLYVIDGVSLSFGIFLLSVIVALWTDRYPTIGFLFCSLAGTAYFGGIVLVYLASPFDLVGFHLPTGNRTMLPVHIILLAASYSFCCGNVKNSAHDLNSL